MERQKRLAIPVALLVLAASAHAADPDGAALYRQHCASCHDASAVTRAPAPAALRVMTPESIVRSLENGAMKAQGATLAAAEKQALAEFLAGKPAGTPAAPQAGLCAGRSEFALSGPAWNGWGADPGNTRFQSEKAAGLSAAEVPKLKLKWAFGFPNTFAANGQPTIAGGRIFVASANRKVYSLDAQTGCQYWSMEPEAPVRTAIVVTGKAAFFGDQRANAYAVDAATGAVLWKQHVDGHPRAKIVGAPVTHGEVVYMPVTAGEEGPAMNPAYECCSGRGSLVALEASTGKQIWKTYAIAEEPHIVGKTKAGRPIWGPSGASIWSAPTIDTERAVIYVGTGDNFSDPPTATSDAVMALDMKTGKVLWVKQLTAGDAFNMACAMPNKESCPESNGPDFDIGASPILITASNGRRVLLVSQKSGVARALDPDKQGEILWETRVGRGGALGGIQWGSASDGKNMYVAVSDIAFASMGGGGGGLALTPDPKAGGGLFALDAVSGKRVWAAPPPSCEGRAHCSPAQSAAVTAIPGVVFSGSVDGHLRAYSTEAGKVIWDFDTGRDFTTVNGAGAKGGSMDGPGPTIAGGMLYVGSGYGAWGGAPGNVLLAFEAK
ncbi:MAG TPA: PQQ-binding-like beta-propeller repeat protein [Bryobacteraceae bacterium]|nr:PQQ-binding-like beta-propeller repeat protein [Bryobacteraceae bacterium]